MENAQAVRDELMAIGFSGPTLSDMPPAAMVDILADAFADIAVIRQKSFQPHMEITRDVIVEELQKRGMQGIGPMGQLLSRLATYMRANGAHSSDVCSLRTSDSICIRPPMVDMVNTTAYNDTMLEKWTYDS